MNTLFDYTYAYFLSLIPVLRRLPKHLAWVSMLLSPIEWLRDNVWNLRKKGSEGYYYNNIVVYLRDSYVNYGNSTYKCLVAGTTGIAPTDTTKWILVCDNYIGWDERMGYTGAKKSLEYALYRFLFTYDISLRFNNVAPNASPNKIFITNTLKTNRFIVNTTFGSAVYSTELDTTEAVYTTYIPSDYEYTINVPTSTRAKFATAAKCTSAVINVVKRYNAAGFRFTVIYY